MHVANEEAKNAEDQKKAKEMEASHYHLMSCVNADHGILGDARGE